MMSIFDYSGIHAYHACPCPEIDCNGRAVAAGYFRTVDGKLEVYGGSTTLGIHSKPSDLNQVQEALIKLK